MKAGVTFKISIWNSILYNTIINRNNNTFSSDFTYFNFINPLWYKHDKNHMTLCFRARDFSWRCRCDIAQRPVTVGNKQIFAHVEN